MLLSLAVVWSRKSEHLDSFQEVKKAKSVIILERYNDHFAEATAAVPVAGQSNEKLKSCFYTKSMLGFMGCTLYSPPEASPARVIFP